MPKLQFCASDLERLKPKQGYWWVPCLFALASCSPAVVNSQYENRQLAEAIENLVPSNQPVSARELPGIEPNSTICVLEPYRDQLDGNDPLAPGVNPLLRAATYRGDENHWAVAQVSGSGRLRISVVRRGRARLGDIRLPSSKSQRCAPAIGLVITADQNRVISFSATE